MSSLPPSVLTSLRSHDPQMPDGPLVYSRNRRVRITDDDFAYGASTNREMEKIARAVFHFQTSFESTVERFGSDYRVLRKPSGPQGVSSGTLYDIFVALRIVRLFAESEWGGLDIKHIFHPEHWYELLRVISMVYDQEYRYNDTGSSDTGFLSEERFFGPGCRRRDCSLSLLYQMFKVCEYYVSTEDYYRFKKYENEDSSPQRLRQLSREYRRRSDDYDTNDQYGDDQLCHVLPLYDQGLTRGSNGYRRRRTQGYGWRNVSIREYDVTPQSRYVYWKKWNYVEVCVVQGWIRMETTTIPQWFINKYDLDIYRDDSEEEGAAYYRLDTLIQQMNERNFHAGKFLISHVYSGKVNVQSAWSPDNYSGGETAEDFLKVKALANVVGDLLETDDGDIILPVSSDGKFGYLTRYRGNKYYMNWREPNSTTVTARLYDEYNDASRLER